MRPRRLDSTVGDVALYLVVVLFWGSTFLWVDLATHQTSPFVVSALRLAVGAVVVLAVSALLGPVVRGAHTLAALRPWLWPGTVLALLAAVVPSVLLAVAQREISSGTASILNATAPLWTALFTWIVIRGPAGRLAPLQIGGLLLGILGVGLLANDAPTAAEVKGMLLVVGLAAVYGSGGVYAQRRFRGAPPLAAAIMVTALGALLAAPLGIAGWSADPPTAGAFWAIVVLGVTSSGFAYVSYFELIRRIGATRTLTVTYLQPVVAIALGVVILGESVTAVHVAGLGLVLLGVAITNARAARTARSPEVVEADSASRATARIARDIETLPGTSVRAWLAAELGALGYSVGGVDGGAVASNVAPGARGVWLAAPSSGAMGVAVAVEACRLANDRGLHLPLRLAVHDGTGAAAVVLAETIGRIDVRTGDHPAHGPVIDGAHADGPRAVPRTALVLGRRAHPRDGALAAEMLLGELRRLAETET